MLSSRSYASFFVAGAITATTCAIRRVANRSSQKITSAHCDDADHHNSDDTHQQHEDHKKVHYGWHKDTPGLTLRFKNFKLAETFDVAPDTKIFRFALDDPNDIFNLAASSTVQMRFHQSPSPDGDIQRMYTPVSPNGQKGSFDLLIRKLPNGMMTHNLFKMKKGDSCDFRAIQFKMKYKPNKFENIGLIAGGTGITPMLQVIRQALPLTGSQHYDPYEEFMPEAARKLSKSFEGVVESAKDDKTKLSLLFANRSESHIMLKGYFDKLQNMFPERFKVAYTIDKPENPETWSGKTGYVTTNMIAETMPTPIPGSRKNILLLCGPDQLLMSLTGCKSKTLHEMHNRGKLLQPSGDQLANLLPVVPESPLGVLGWNQENMYRF